MYRNAVEGITSHSDLAALSDNVEAGTWHSFLLSLSRWGAGAGASASAGTGDRRSCSQQPRPGHGNIGECMLLLLLGWLMKFWRL